MKKIYIIFLMLFLETAAISMVPASAKAQVSVSFQVFYDRLSPYGTWVNYPTYGYVWIPTAVPYGFRPYSTGGHWIYTSDGWAWVSDYSWGWAAFHYGNWFYDNNYGWMWVPGYAWAPAWVTWGEYGDDYCWAPIGPRIDIGVSFGSYRPPGYCWTFAPRAYITDIHINRYYVNHIDNTTIVNNIRVINNVNRSGSAFMKGPQPQNVVKYTHTTIRPVHITNAEVPGRSSVQNGQIAMYRPAINRTAAAGRPAPTHVQDMHELSVRHLPAANSHVQTNTKPAPAMHAPTHHVNAPVGRPAPSETPASHPVNNHPSSSHHENNRAASTPVNKPVNPPAQANHRAPDHSHDRPKPPQQPPRVQPNHAVGQPHQPHPPAPKPQEPHEK
ncbi:MAG TPA: DUF6600 domain-containing protein [Puia sp.]|nr:DUF6600 domain-containing protein [Puia sp.]